MPEPLPFPLPDEAEMVWENILSQRVPRRINRLMCDLNGRGNRYPLVRAWIALALQRVPKKRRARILEGVRCFFAECERLDLKGVPF